MDLKSLDHPLVQISLDLTSIEEALRLFEGALRA